MYTVYDRENQFRKSGRKFFKKQVKKVKGQQNRSRYNKLQDQTEDKKKLDRRLDRKVGRKIKLKIIQKTRLKSIQKTS